MGNGLVILRSRYSGAASRGVRLIAGAGGDTTRANHRRQNHDHAGNLSETHAPRGLSLCRDICRDHAGAVLAVGAAGLVGAKSPKVVMVGLASLVPVAARQINWG